MSAYRYWRLRITEVVNSQDWVGFAEFELRASNGGPSIITSGVASGSSEHSAPYTADKAVDGDVATLWHTDFENPPWWWMYVADNPLEAVEYAITVPASHPQRAPLDWWLEVSLDGLDWLTVDERAGEAFTVGVANVYPGDFSSHLLSGIAKFSDGEVADVVRIWIRDGGAWIKDVVPGVDGSFSALVATAGPYDLVIMRDNYRPLAHGPVLAIAV